jgi:methionyl-tRNA formyltransferase
MRIAFFGLPLAAVLLAADGHDITYAAVCRRGAIGTRRLARAVGAGRIAILPDLTREASVTRVKRAAPDLVVSWFWTKKIPPRIVALAPLGGFGVHPSLLPRHRGPDPYFWAIDAGDALTGVTAHRLAADYDTGAILGRRSLAIDPAWSAWTLAKRLDRPSLALLRDTARAFAAHLAGGSAPREEAQDESRATLAPQPDDALFELVWSWSTERVVRRVRAASPWPGAFTELGGEELVLTRVAPARSYPRALAPGEAAVVGGVAVVRTGDGAIALVEGRSGDDEELDGAALAARVTRGVGVVKGEPLL